MSGTGLEPVPLGKSCSTHIVLHQCSPLRTWRGTGWPAPTAMSPPHCDQWAAAIRAHRQANRQARRHVTRAEAQNVSTFVCLEAQQAQQATRDIGEHIDTQASCTAPRSSTEQVLSAAVWSIQLDASTGRQEAQASIISKLHSEVQGTAALIAVSQRTASGTAVSWMAQRLVRVLQAAHQVIEGDLLQHHTCC